MKRLIFLISLLVLITLSSVQILVFAQDGGRESIPDDDVNAIAKQLYCPVCENIPLDVCGTQACAQWRELIREKLALGWDEDKIKEYFVLQYGDRVLAEPPRRGLNWLVYIIPPVAFILGAFLLYRGIRSWQKSGDEEPDGVGEADVEQMEDYISQMEEELRRSSR